MKSGGGGVRVMRMNENQGKKQKEWEDAVKARQRGRAAGWREAESDIKSTKERETIV